MKKVTRPPVAPEEHTIDQKATLGLTLWLMLAVHFTLNYVNYTYYSKDMLRFESPGYWISALNTLFLVSLVIFNKRIMRWTWSNLGLKKPANWWQPILFSVGLFGILVFFSRLVQPNIIEIFGKHQNIGHYFALEGNLPLFLTTTIGMWITRAFLQEVVFRAFLINALDILLGKTFWSEWTAVLASAVIFAGVHAYQGITGILTTGFIGLIFGIAYILNGRRIWPLMLVHGLVNTLTYFSIYSS